MLGNYILLEKLNVRERDCDDTKKFLTNDCSKVDWYYDNDGDGYYAQKKNDYKVRKPEGDKWNTTSSQGHDCNDNKIFLTTNCPKPCANDWFGNPLEDLSILGTRNNGVSGGLYGNGRGRFHDGADFDTSVGTPIYSIHDGTVDFSVTSHAEGEKWSNRKNWNGDKNAAGNRVYVSSNVCGDNYQFGFWHLSEVATNPTTGEPYKNGDTVKQGDIIGYSGTTGNANSDDSAGPHVHIRGRKNGNVYDPIDSFLSPIDHITGQGFPCDYDDDRESSPCD